MKPAASIAEPGAPARRSDDRWLWALFVVAWFLNFGFSLVGWENTLISRFEFRQVQTALTTRYFPAGGFPLAYETPVFGPPWSIPLSVRRRRDSGRQSRLHAPGVERQRQ